MRKGQIFPLGFIQMIRWPFAPIVLSEVRFQDERYTLAKFVVRLRSDESNTQ